MLPPRSLIVRTVLLYAHIVFKGGRLRNIVLRNLGDDVLNQGQLKFLILLVYCGLIAFGTQLPWFLVIFFCRQSATSLLVRINAVIEYLHEVFHAFVHARSGSGSLFWRGTSIAQICISFVRSREGIGRRGQGPQSALVITCFLTFVAPIYNWFIPIKILILYKRCRLLLVSIESARRHNMPTARCLLLLTPIARSNLQKVPLRKGHLSIVKHYLKGLFQVWLRWLHLRFLVVRGLQKNNNYKCCSNKGKAKLTI